MRGKCLFHARERKRPAVLAGCYYPAAVRGSSAPCFAQYPDRPIRVLTPFPPGGAVDLDTRLVTDRMASNLGRSFVVEAKAGAGGIIATDAVAKSEPDGYTLLITTPNHTINAALQSKLPYDTESDLAPIAIMAAVPEVLVSYPAAPFDDFAGFVKYAKANPGKLRLFVGRHRHAAPHHHGTAAQGP